jgi:hypothetical protein
MKGWSWLAVVLMAVGCGHSPSSPSSSTSALTLTGIWQVTYSGRYSPVGCRTPAYTTLTTTFGLVQNGTSVSGTIFDVDVGGTADADGNVTLSGDVTQFGSRSTARATLHPTSDRSNFTGAVQATIGQSTTLPLCGYSVDAQIVEAHRIPFDSSEGSYAGVWEGSFGVQECSFVGWTYCYPAQQGTTSSLTLRATQTGQTVDGTLRILAMEIPVTGTIAGGQLVLQGSATTVVSGGREVVRITDWSTSRDSLGRMTGSFSHEHRYEQDNGQTFSTTSHNVLVRVWLMP